MAKQAYYFSHDTNARRDPKILAMRNQYGNEGYGWYWILIEMLAEQEGYKMKHKQWSYYGIAMDMLCDADAVEKFVISLIEDYELLSSDGEHFWSESLLRRMEIKEAKREKRVEAGKKGAKSRWSNTSDTNEDEKPKLKSDGNAIAMVCDSHSNGMANDGKVKESKGKESKVKERKDNTVIVEIVNYLNDTVGTKYRPTTKKIQSLIEARLNEGFEIEDFKSVITKKCSEWIGTEWEKFLRPETLFSNKFESYLNQKVSKPQDKFKNTIDEFLQDEEGIF